MKLLLIILLCIVPAGVFSQGGSPVHWEVSSRDNGGGNYHIFINGLIAPNWYVYASDDVANGLEAIKISYENINVGSGKLEPLINAETYLDPVFGSPQKIYRNGITFSQYIKLGRPEGKVAVNIRGFSSNTIEFLPIDTTIEVVLDEKLLAGGNKNLGKLPGVDLDNPIAKCGDNQAAEKDISIIFFLGFGGGLLALLTPCVFPMIPVTVSFFTNRSRNRKGAYRNGLLYGFFILLIYLLASIPFHLMGNISPEIFNTISTNAWLNVFFFVVFILFALSFFGVFEIRLPSFIANSSGNKGGIFFMALTLAIVSFSCTGPILGSLLVGSLSAKGNAWELTAGMGGFGLALGLPFALFAFFPSWLKALPKSGGWMEVVKKSLAFVELALAVKFLSNADMVEHWGILPREVFIGLWILISAGLAMYLFGVFDKRQTLQPSTVLRIAGQSPLTKQSLVFNGRRGFGILTLAFTLYLVPGVTQFESANLKLLSGFPPPLSYSVYGKNNIHGKGLEPDVVNDYEKAVKMAREENKPLLIDFTGWACVNCRKMEEHVWTEPAIKELISKNYILVSLYVDDRKKMDNGITVGKWNANFQATNFGQVTQPLYVILTPDEKLINYPIGYTPDETEYGRWLQCGLEAYSNHSTAYNK